MSDREKFMAALARASIGQIPVADIAAHERVARETVEAHPGLAEQALATGNYLPLVRIAKHAEAGLVELWLAQRIGQIVRAGAEPRHPRMADEAEARRAQGGERA